MVPTQISRAGRVYTIGRCLSPSEIVTIRRMFRKNLQEQPNYHVHEVVDQTAKRLLYDSRTIFKYCVENARPKRQGRVVSLDNFNRKKNLFTILLLEIALNHNPALELRELQDIVRQVPSIAIDLI